MSTKKLNTRPILILLSLVMILSLFSGCGKQGDGTETTTENVTGNSGGEGNTEETLIKPSFDNIDFNVEIGILQRESAPKEEWDPDAEDNPILEQALIERNGYLYDKYGMEFTYYYCSDQEFTTTVSNAIQTELMAYHAISYTSKSLSDMAIKGLLRTMQSVENVNLDNPWWSKQINDRLAYNGYNFFAVGNSNISSMWRTSAIYFNKDIAEAEGLSISQLYDSVFEREWTLELMLQYAKQATKDGGDGLEVISKQDTFGIIQTNAWYPALCGTGLTFASVGEDGTFQANAADQVMVDRVTSIIDYMNDAEIALPLSAGIDQYSHFCAGKGLFLVEGIAATNVVRESEVNYGILPCPLGESGQEEYHNYVHQGHNSAMAVPADVLESELPMVGAFLESAGYSSRVEIWPAFYKTLMKGQVARDPESAEIMDIIFFSMTTDIGLVYSNIYDNAVRDMVTNNKYDVVKSTLDNAKPFMQNVLDQVNEMYKTVIAEY